MVHSREEIGKVFIRYILLIWFSSEIMLSTTIEKFIYWKKNDVNAFMAVLVLTLLLVQIFVFQKYSTRDMLLIVITSVPIIIGAINAGNYNLMSTWLFIIAAKYIDFEDIVELSLVVLVITIPIVIYMFAAGYITEITLTRPNITRHSLGFSHPNWLGMRVFQVVISFCYVNRNRSKLINLLVIFIAGYFVYKVPNCQTAYLALTILGVFIVLDWLLGFVKNGKLFFSKLLILIAATANIVSVFLSMIDLRGHKYLLILDKLLSRRFSSCHRTMNYYGITPFGTVINLYASKVNSARQIFHLDTAYMTIMLRYGVIVYLIFSVFYIITMIKCLNKNRQMLIIVYCMYAIYGIMEKNFFVMSQNVFLFAMTYTLFFKQFDKDKKESLDYARIAFVKS